MSLMPRGGMHPDSAPQCQFCWLYFMTATDAIDHEETCRSKPEATEEDA